MGRGQVQDSQAGTSSQAGQTICYFIRQLGHMRQDCPGGRGLMVLQDEHTEQPNM